MKRLWNVLIAALIGGLIVAFVVAAFVAIWLLTFTVGPPGVIVGSLMITVVSLALLHTNWGKRDFRGRQ